MTAPVITCPTCRQACAEAIGSGLYQCANSWQDYVMGYAMPPSPVGTRTVYCRTRFEVDTPKEPHRRTCFCQKLYAVYYCSECFRSICKDHLGKQVQHKRWCVTCTTRVDARAAYEDAQPYYRAMATIIATADHNERVVRWLTNPGKEHYTPSEHEIEHCFREAFPEQAGLRTQGLPYFNHDQMINWFLRRTTELGLSAPIALQTWVTKHRVLRGDTVAPGPVLPAWPIPAGPSPTTTEPHALRDAYLLLDGRCVLAGHQSVPTATVELDLFAVMEMSLLLGLWSNNGTRWWWV